MGAALLQNLHRDMERVHETYSAISDSVTIRAMQQKASLASEIVRDYHALQEFNATHPGLVDAEAIKEMEVHLSHLVLNEFSIAAKTSEHPQFLFSGAEFQHATLTIINKFQPLIQEFIKKGLISLEPVSFIGVQPAPYEEIDRVVEALEEEFPNLKALFSRHTERGNQKPSPPSHFDSLINQIRLAAPKGDETEALLPRLRETISHINDLISTAPSRIDHPTEARRILNLIKQYKHMPATLLEKLEYEEHKMEERTQMWGRAPENHYTPQATLSADGNSEIITPPESTPAVTHYPVAERRA